MIVAIALFDKNEALLLSTFVLINLFISTSQWDRYPQKTKSFIATWKQIYFY